MAVELLGRYHTTHIPMHRAGQQAVLNQQICFKNINGYRPKAKNKKKRLQMPTGFASNLPRISLRDDVLRAQREHGDTLGIWAGTLKTD